MVVDVRTLVDGNPDSNFVKEAARFDPNGVLTGATYVAAATGHRLLYLTTPRGLRMSSTSRKPEHPRIVRAALPGSFLRNPRCVAIRFSLCACVTDDDDGFPKGGRCYGS